ncbi:hypothetical protein A5893_15645 [Pedobacter psychrophilus]|uniref:histidine kinase n=1 Tax=Pedobacter psychrophilus TaxID=1826909 RepID=A0A179DCH1_9SPHI|nr:ATP-binding protein [Pedobacter psychrophilus]OAQ38229.1 hypothetical protein A5893_15645 [Pedobacter psychrophilus]
MDNNILIINEVKKLLKDSYACRIYDLKQSIRLSSKALAISKILNDQFLIGKSLNQLSLFYMISGSYKQAMSMAKKSILVFKLLEDENGLADASYNIASIHYKTDNYHLGLINLMDCLTVYQKNNDYFNQARVHKSLGTIYEYFGDEGNAISSYKKAIVASNKINNKSLLSNVYNPLSGIYLKQSKVDKAFKLIDKSIELKNQNGDIRGLAFAIYGRAKIYTFTGDYELAEKDFKTSIEIHIKSGEKLGLGMAYQKLGLLYLKWGKLKEAKETLLEAIRIGETYNTMIIKFKSNFLLYQIAKQENKRLDALYYLELYLSQKEKVINTQTLQIIKSYDLITKMKSLEKDEQLRKEKAVILEKKDIAEQSARIKQDFLSTMSHEIRTPLNAITTISTILSEKYIGDDKNLIDSLNAASVNLLLIINDILDFTKLDHGKVVIDLRPKDLKTILKRTITTYELDAKQKNIKLNLEVDDQIKGWYELDETKLSQVLNNLISNGIKFTDKGSVTLKVSKIKELGEKDSISFEVSDTGAGISEDFYDKIFETFSQPKSITTKKHVGTGLGLAIVKKIIAIYGSKITFKSKVGIGTKFQFTLQLKRDALVHELPAQEQDHLKGKRILLSEDNQINAMVAMKVLSNWGINTDHAINGIEAVEKAKLVAYDFILMDIHMPELNGFDATKQIREDKNINQFTPIFALTADITAESREENSSHFNGFLSKPIEIKKLYQTLTDFNSKLVV